MGKYSIARFTATAIIVAAVILFLIGILPVIAIAIGGLGAGWGPGSRLWLVLPLAAGACGGALLLLAFGGMLGVLIRIQDNLARARQQEAEAAATVVTPASVQPPVASRALPEAAVASAAIAAGAPPPAAHPEVAVAGPEVAVAAAEVEAATRLVEVSAPEAEAGGPGLGAVVAGAGVAAAAFVAAKAAGGEPEAEAPEAAPEGVAPVAAEVEAAAPLIEVGAPEVEAGGLGLGAVAAGAGLAAVAVAAAREGEAEAEAAGLPATAVEPEPGGPTVEISDLEEAPAELETGLLEERGIEAIAIGAGLAAATAAEEAEPEALATETAAAEVIAEVPTEETIAPEAETGTPVIGAPAVTAPAAATRAWAYDEGTSKVVRAASAVRVEGIGETYADKLKELGITTTATLLRWGATPKGRQDLAEKTGISPKLILKWINRVDLSRIRGISEQYSDLLEAAGVDTVPELAQRKPENLYQKLVEVNTAKRLVRRLPTQQMVANWIQQAKELPRVVVYK